MTDDFQIEKGILISYTGREETVQIPEGVHTIEEGALKACVSLKRVVLPSTLRKIGDHAFKGCRRLEEVEMPGQISHIGSYAFHRCHALKRMILPQSVEELGDCTFLYCDSLTEIRMPGVKRLGRQVFVNDVLLERLVISEELREEDICDVFTGCGKIREIIFAGGKRCVIPNAVETVAAELPVPPLVRLIAVDILRMMELEQRTLIRFRTNLKHVEIPEGIEVLAKSCFFDKRGILSVRLPKSLKQIGERAFRNCINLECVSFAGERVRICGDAFKNCTSLKMVRACDGKEYVFEGLAGLAGTDTPKMVQSIYRQVMGNFRISGTILLKYLGCESRVAVPDGITRIAEEAFAGNEAIDRVLLPESVREIGAEAFRDCLLLQTIPLPDGLEKIGPGAFQNCVKLIRIHLPAGVRQIRERTFRRCVTLREVCLPEGFSEIGESAFYGCTALKKVEFPESLRTVDAMAFYRCGALAKVRLPPGTEYVGNLAFAGSGVRRAWIGGSGRLYGTDVFGGCRRLKTLALEEGMQHIPDKLAYGCTALERVLIPGSIRSAGRHPWEGTPFLAHWLEQRDALQEADPDGRIFWDGRGLEGIVRLVDRLQPDAGERLFEKKQDPEMEKPGSMFCEAGGSGQVQSPAQGAFAEKERITRVYVPNRMQILAGGAFYGNDKVTEVYLPASIRWIGPAAFKGCTHLRRVWIPSAAEYLEADTFSGCRELKEVLVSEESTEIWKVSGQEEPDKTEGSELPGLPVWKTIGERAFYQCSSLQRVRLDQAKRIEKEAFAGCRALEKGSVFCGIETVGERAFEDTCYLIPGEGEATILAGILLSGSDFGGEIRLPEGVTGIAPYAFAGNREVTKVMLPKSLRWIGDGAFYGCSGLREVEFPEGLRRIGRRAFEKCIRLEKIETGAWQAGEAAFAGCIRLKEAVVPNLAILGKRLFAGCRKLETCRPGRAQAVFSWCFSGCSALKHISLGNIAVVRSCAFERCDSLKEIELRDEACLGAHALEDCGGLEKILLTGEKGIVHLSEYALSGCTALQKVVLGEAEWEFGSYRDLCNGQLPEMVRLLFQSAFSCFEVEQEENLCGYRGAGQRVRIPEGIRRIGAEVFRDVLMLREVEIPDSVEYIGARAFHGTEWLRRQKEQDPMVAVNGMLLDGSGCTGEVTVPEEIRLVCGWAFAGGLDIRKICFRSEAVRVEEYAFRNCINLREVELADGACVRFFGISDRDRELPSLAKQAVQDSMNCFKTDADGVLVECTGNLSRLTLADGITAIGDSAFEDGNLLTGIVFPGTVKRIGKRAFAGCKWLQEVHGAVSVEQIGVQAYSGCGMLRRVELSEVFRQMGSRAFENCTSLEEILLPEGLEEIPERAFYRCHSLKRVQLPSTLKRIGREAFAFCRELREVYVPEGAEIGERAFEGLDRMMQNLI